MLRVRNKTTTFQSHLDFIIKKKETVVVQKSNANYTYNTNNNETLDVLIYSVTILYT